MKISINIVFVVFLIILSGLCFSQDTSKLDEVTDGNGSSLKTQSSILTEVEINKLAADITIDEINKTNNYSDMIALFNSKICKKNKDIDECWYFSRKNLKKIEFPKTKGTPQKQLLLALKSQFLNVCIVHSILCVVDSGIYFHAETKTDLIKLRMKICGDYKICKWASELLSGEDKKAAQLELDKHCNRKMRMLTKKELEEYQYHPDFKDNEILANRLDSLNYVKYLYPEPNFKEIYDRVKSKKMRDTFKLVEILLSSDIEDDDKIDELVKSEDTVKKEAGALLKKVSEAIKPDESAKVKGKEVWALICSSLDNPYKLTAFLKKELSDELNDESIGGVITGLLLTITVIKSDDSYNTDELLEYLKYIDLETGFADLIVQSVSCDTKIKNVLIKKFVELNVFESAIPLFALAKEKNQDAIKALLKFNISESCIASIQEQWKTTISKDWKELLVKVCLENLNEESILILNNLYETLTIETKVEIIKSFGSYPNTNTLYTIFNELDSNNEKLHEAAMKSVKALFYEQYLQYKDNKDSWLEYWSTFSDVPGYKEIKKKVG